MVNNRKQSATIGPKSGMRFGLLNSERNQKK